MTFQTDLPRHIRGVEYFSLTAALKNFRQSVERETDTPIQTIEMNMALVIDDIAKHLGLGERQRAEILGTSASAFVSSVENEPVKLNVKH